MNAGDEWSDDFGDAPLADFDPNAGPFTEADRALGLHWVSIIGANVPVRAWLVRRLLKMPERCAACGDQMAVFLRRANR